MRELMPTPRVVDARAVAGQMTQMSQIKKLTERRELSMLEPHSRPAASVVTSLIGPNQARGA